MGRGSHRIGWHRYAGRRSTGIGGKAIATALVRLGYDEQAAAVGARIGQAVAAAGLREYYDPFTGRGMGATDFSWSALVMELIDPDPTARSSHIPMPVVG